MACEKCINIRYDKEDLFIKFVIGHHPSCEEVFKDKKKFIDEFNAHVELSASGKLINEIDKYISKKEERTNPKNPSDSIPNGKNTKELIKSLYLYLFGKYDCIVPNSYIYNWESDVLAINKTNHYVYEYEVKTSRTDFKADFKKEAKHSNFNECYLNSINCNKLPNFFYYVTPVSLLTIEDIPSYAGLIEIGIKPKVIKRAPKLHSEQIDSDFKFLLLYKLYYKFWNEYLK